LFNVDPNVYRILTPDFQNFKSQVELAAPGMMESNILQPLQPSSVQFTQESPERYVLTVDSPYQNGWLVMTEGFFPGWQATIDGKPVPLYQANHRFMAMAVPKGKHSVTLAYTSTYFGLGVLLSLLGLVLAGMLLCWNPISREKKNDP
jgi:uncharacterized membrane protein YfhO